MHVRPLLQSPLRSILRLTAHHFAPHSPFLPSMRQNPKRARPSSSPHSWESAGDWYDKLVGERGHYYHRTLILPETLQWLETTKPIEALIDLGCGQGVLQRALPPKVPYLGIDNALDLIELAKSRSPKAHFRQVDLSKDWRDAPLKAYSHACLLLSLQNMSNGQQVLRNAARCLRPGGHLLIALNHPCFRIPRQSSWLIDEVQNRQSRRIETYMSAMEVPLVVHPSRANEKKGGKLPSPETWSFHHPVSTYVHWLVNCGFTVSNLWEWMSDKSSTGTHARRENRARGEFPLFLAMHCTLTGETPHSKAPASPPS